MNLANKFANMKLCYIIKKNLFKLSNKCQGNFNFIYLKITIIFFIENYICLLTFISTTF